MQRPIDDVCICFCCDLRYSYKPMVIAFVCQCVSSEILHLNTWALSDIILMWGVSCALLFIKITHVHGKPLDCTLHKYVTKCYFLRYYGVILSLQVRVQK